MISTTTRIRIKNILLRLETNQLVTLEERIFLNKLSNVSPLISGWVSSALAATGANKLNAAGATNKLLKSFIVSSHN